MKTNYIKLTAALCIFYFTVCIQAHAQIIYTDVNPDITSSGTYNLDLDNNGTTDFVIKHTTSNTANSNQCASSATGTEVDNFIKVNSSNNNEIVYSVYTNDAYSENQAVRMAVNSVIDASALTWTGSNNLFMISSVWGCYPFWYSYYWSTQLRGQWTWYNGSDAFLGLKLKMNGHSYYGWAHISISSAQSFTVLDYAYNSTADQAILAGQMTTDYVGVSPVEGSLCAGNGVTVPYIINGTFAVSNVVTAQLSDATGSFASPVNIGSVVSNVSGTINATIPGTTPSGNAYRIRVVSSNPARTSLPEANVIHITGGLPNANISTGSNTNLCNSDYYGVYLYANNGNCITYQWQLNGNDVAGATSYNFSPTAPGDYTCVETNGAGSATSNAITVTATPTPAQIIFCCGPNPESCGGSINLYGITGNYSKQWQLNGVDIPGATDYNYDATVTGDYTCVKTNSCGSVTSNIIHVTIYPDMDDAVITATGPTTTCSGSVTLNANISADVTYAWYFQAPSTYTYTVIPGATASSYQASTSGSYYVLETNSNGCTRYSNSISTLIGTPAVPTIFPSPSTLSICQGNPVYLYLSPYVVSYTYQWTKNGVDISGAVGYSYYASHTGTYSVKVSLGSSCSSSATPVVVTHGCRLDGDNSSEEDLDLISASPNPFSNSTNISFVLNEKQNVSLKIFDVNGRLVSTLANNMFEAGEHQVTWDAYHIERGIYFLSMETTNGIQNQKLVVTK